MEAEVFVVDNNSVDGSVEMVQDRFPWVMLIANKENTGFSVANNQAIKESKGEYVLLLNPDTLVEADTFEKTVGFMDAHREAGGLGVRMVDGKGDFLPESKRSLPTPEVAFYKIFGLSSFFPKSKRFGKYHLGFLDEKNTHEVEVLSGAFMMMRKKTLDEVGLLDETFFMYGEDIDLSYRIIKGGYKNYYFPEARIIHYKGESTKKAEERGRRRGQREARARREKKPAGARRRRRGELFLFTLGARGANAPRASRDRGRSIGDGVWFYRAKQ